MRLSSACPREQTAIEGAQHGVMSDAHQRRQPLVCLPYCWTSLEAVCQGDQPGERLGLDGLDAKCDLWHRRMSAALANVAPLYGNTRRLATIALDNDMYNWHRPTTRSENREILPPDA